MPATLPPQTRIGRILSPRRPGPAPRTPVLDRLCIAVLAVDWIVFGSMHFPLHGETRAMLPPWVPWPDAVVTATGMAEVTIGILMLYGRARRLAAVGSLVLLVLYIPAVAHILSHAAALPFPPESWPARAWRLLGVPHNVLLAICSVHVIGKPYPDPWDPGAAPPAARHGVRGGAVLLVAGVLLLCNAAGFLAVLLGVRANLPTAAMWMMMCLAVGGLLGFLFAVPRVNARAESRAALVPNRNIEAISDWLTKILVGLGLVNFKDIAAFVAGTAATLGPQLGVEPSYVQAFLL
ncbi:DoxX-like family protein [Dankookia sp. GCM10030260]|uniref:DoxX-like family protein n=1 Tax=Dankookia sp. GCM10030260 TaxID=3273390 RepID=UPI0036216C61